MTERGELGHRRVRSRWSAPTVEPIGRRALQEFRRRTCGVPPESLALGGLADSLPLLAARFSDRGRQVDLAIAPMPRPSAEAEELAYLVVAEAFSNLTQHSQASVCRVWVGPVLQRICVSVWDDGVGGAHLAVGQALHTLAWRARARGDRLDLRSPYGGPTALTIHLAR